MVFKMRHSEVLFRSQTPCSAIKEMGSLPNQFSRVCRGRPLTMASSLAGSEPNNASNSSSSASGWASLGSAANGTRVPS